MRFMHRQRGLGWFGMLWLLAAIALVAIVVVKTLPLYLNQMKIASAVHKAANDPEVGRGDVRTIRNDLQRYWDIDSVDTLAVTDVQVIRGDHSRTLSYDYEARAHLFYNIYIVIEFADDVPLPAANTPS